DGVADKASELHGKGLVEPQVGAQLGALLGRGVLAEQIRHGIADILEQHERDERDREHHDHGLDEAAKDEGEHWSDADATPPGHTGGCWRPEGGRGASPLLARSSVGYLSKTDAVSQRGNAPTGYSPWRHEKGRPKAAFAKLASEPWIRRCASDRRRRSCCSSFRSGPGQC